MDRLPYLLDRWKGKIVIGLSTSTDEIEETVKAIKPYSTIERLKFVFYVKENNPSVKPYYQGRGGKRSFDSIFPINFLRDLCIESITTTHYLYLDGDVFVSGTISLSLLIRSSISIHCR